MEQKTKNKFRIIGGILAVFAMLFITGCGLKSTPVQRSAIKLEVWGLFDDSDTFGNIIQAYHAANPNVVEIKYRKLTVDTYKKELLDAMASGQGPDIFMIQNTWLPSFADKVVAAPDTILNEQQFRGNFVDVAASDFLNQGKVYAVPLSVDSLGLYYNKDLFNQAGITAPPATWNDFVADVQKLTKVNSYGQIIQSGAAIGTAYNINRSTDILNLIMLQDGVQMTDSTSGRAIFDQGTRKDENGSTVFGGVEALNFYTQFARANSSFYSWNPNMHYSTDAFSEGTLGMMLNYSWQISTLFAKSPKLNYAIAPVPQLNASQPVNFPNYWGYAVAKNKTAVTLPNQPAVPDDMRIAETWNFLKFLTTKPVLAAGQTGPTFDAAAEYIKTTGKPAARKDILETQKSDPKIGAFAYGNLIAKDWIEIDAVSIEAIFARMIDDVNRGAATAQDAIRAAATQVSQLTQ
jgi:multiple sugar transport system substrate-binding protein